MSRCKSCGKEIVWVKLETGKWNPCDKGRIPYIEDANGEPGTGLDGNGNGMVNWKRRGRGMIRAVPLSQKEANAYIDQFHRHHNHAQGDKFRIGAEVDGKLVGVAQCGRPVSRHLDDGKTLEVIRLCTDGSKNVCSFLYSRCAKAAQMLGYEKIVTYILESEMGTSLKASGWYCEEKRAGGGSWNCPSRPRELEPEQTSMFGGGKTKYPTEKKQRWAKKLKQ